MKSNKTIWQEFCYDLVEARKEDILEEPYQNIVEMNLRQLGWSKVQGEICPKERINIGSHNQIESDITLKIEDKPVFVIEMKRPRNIITPRQEQQLLSYMRLQKTTICRKIWCCKAMMASSLWYPINGLPTISSIFSICWKNGDGI